MKGENSKDKERRIEVSGCKPDCIIPERACRHGKRKKRERDQT